MRLPNGFGSVTKLSGNRRKPWIARKLCGYSEGKQVYRVIGYFETYADGVIALKTYNDSEEIKPVVTFAKCYKDWISTHRHEVSTSSLDSYKTAYKHLKPITSKPIDKLTYNDLQSIIDTMRSKGLSYSSCKKSSVSAEHGLRTCHHQKSCRQKLFAIPKTRKKHACKAPQSHFTAKNKSPLGSWNLCRKNDFDTSLYRDALR